AYTLIDTGTDTDMVSSEFAQAAKVKTFRLDAPVGLQMACIGSRSKINYGARADLAVGKLLIKNKYLDIANIDRYDMILGVPFLWEAKAILNFADGGKLTIHGMDFTLVDSDFAVNTAPEMTPELRQHLQDYWMKEIADLTGPIPEVLPPLREVNHAINLIEEGIRFPNRPAKCTDALRPQLMDKIDRYVRAGWWQPVTTQSAPPMLCLAK
ncbi:hypothetical protein EXIGLDRAFT_569313, partial [Exidia glandulosa HHB12029]